MGVNREPSSSPLVLPGMFVHPLSLDVDPPSRVIVRLSLLFFRKNKVTDLFLNLPMKNLVSKGPYVGRHEDIINIQYSTKDSKVLATSKAFLNHFYGKIRLEKSNIDPLIVGIVTLNIDAVIIKSAARQWFS